MTARIITTAQAESICFAHCTLPEAADKLGCSVSAIRRAAKRAGVTRISGSTVAGILLFDRHPVPVGVCVSQVAAH